MQQCQRHNSAGLAASLIVKDAKGWLIAVVFVNTNAAARFLQVFDSATLPADTAVPLISISVAAGATYVLSFPGFAAPMQNGIVLCNSSTAATKTIGAADSLFTALYL